MGKSLEDSSLLSGLEISLWRMGLLGVAICFANRTSEGFESPILHWQLFNNCLNTWKVNQEGSWACLLNKGRLLAWASIALLSIKIIKKGCYL